MKSNGIDAVHRNRRIPECVPTFDEPDVSAVVLGLGALLSARGALAGSRGRAKSTFGLDVLGGHGQGRGVASHDVIHNQRARDGGISGGGGVRTAARLAAVATASTAGEAATSTDAAGSAGFRQSACQSAAALRAATAFAAAARARTAVSTGRTW